MGTIANEPFASFVLELAAAHNIRSFVETGTYVGNTALWASKSFERVFTVEINAELQARAKRRCAARSNIDFLLGRSEEALPEILGKLAGSAVFWLDAHAGGGHFGDRDDCPLLSELSAIAARGDAGDLIIVDDARAFVAPPPPPFDAAAWPTLHQVLDAADPRRERYCVVIGDMVICAPPAARDLVIAFCAKLRPTI